MKDADLGPMLVGPYSTAAIAAMAARRQRDEARERVVALEAALRDCADALEDEIERRLSLLSREARGLPPVVQRCAEDMAPVLHARDLLYHSNAPDGGELHS